jgi:hypothetical protein
MTYFTSKLDLNLRKKLVKCYIWSFVWCWNLDTSESRSDIPGKFWNVVLKKNGEDQLDRSCEKWRVLHSVKEERNILHTIKRRKANWIGHILCRNCSETRDWRKVRRNDRNDRKTREKT